MDVRTVDPVDDDAIARWYAVHAAARVADAPGLPVIALAEVQAHALAGGEIGREEFWLGVAGGVDVAALRLNLPLKDNLGLVMMDLSVHPQHRRRGHGRELLAHAVRRARELGRERVITEVIEPPDGGGRAASVAAAAGFRQALVEAHRVLELAEVDLARLDALERDASAAAGGYELVAWTGPVPDDLVAGYTSLVARMSTDAPMGELAIEPEAWDVARVRTLDEVLAAQGRTMVGTAARHRGSGELVAYSTIGVTRHDPENSFQWDTLVRLDHRGHRLGMLVKVANLRRLMNEAPRALRVHTWNADSNRHMIAINEAMGFVVVQREAEWQLELE